MLKCIKHNTQISGYYKWTGSPRRAQSFLTNKGLIHVVYASPVNPEFPVPNISKAAKIIFNQGETGRCSQNKLDSARYDPGERSPRANRHTIA